MLSFSDLPATEPGLRVSLEIPPDQAVHDMTEGFVHIMKESNWLPGMPCFGHMMPVAGLPSSCRIILDHPYQNISVPLPARMTQQEMAEDIVTEFKLKARFPSSPAATGNGTSHKCFEIRKICFGERVAVMLIAGWMDT